MAIFTDIEYLSSKQEKITKQNKTKVVYEQGQNFW